MRELYIKGHGGSDIIMLSDSDGVDSLALIGGRILIGGDDATRLLWAVTGPGTTIWLVGCGTGPLAQDMSGILGDNVLIWGARCRSGSEFPGLRFLSSWTSRIETASPFTVLRSRRVAIQAPRWEQRRNPGFGRGQ